MLVIDKQMLLDWFDDKEVDDVFLCEKAEHALKTKAPVVLSKNGRLTGKRAELGTKFTIIEKEYKGK